MAAKCGVCEVNAAKYKCPKCRLPYCSVVCYKNHQQVPCEPAAVNVDAPPQALPAAAPAPAATSADNEHAAQLARLEKSDELRTALADPALQAMVRSVHTAQNPAEALESALKQDPALAQLAQLILRATQPSSSS